MVSISHMLNVPSHCFITGSNILGERDVGMAINGNAVVIVQSNQLSESPMPGKGSSFGRNTFHVATISHDDICVVINQVHSRLVVASCQVLLSNCKSNCISNSLSQWPSCDFDSLGQEILWMSWGLRSPLTELLQVLNSHVVSHQVKERVVKHRSVSSGQNKAITTQPGYVFWIGCHEILEEDIGHGSTPHRKSRMSRVSLVHTINRKETNGIDCQLSVLVLDFSRCWRSSSSRGLHSHSKCAARAACTAWLCREPVESEADRLCCDCERHC
mmetsp:Transcript_6851/g.13635  ORF Transcript_6851/g.13635 Transcript_6851/m.13635 type:complete len:272 (-) Transcript_6851:81-896(-)